MDCPVAAMEEHEGELEEEEEEDSVGCGRSARTLAEGGVDAAIPLTWSPSRPAAVVAGCCTDEGSDHANEDRFIVELDALSCEHHPLTLLAVLDGHDGGRCASFLKSRLVEYVRTYLTEAVLPEAPAFDDQDYGIGGGGIDGESDELEMPCEACGCRRAGVSVAPRQLGEALVFAFRSAEQAFLSWARPERNNRYVPVAVASVPLHLLVLSRI